MSLTQPSFGQIVSALRRKMGLSQEELADRAGVHRTYVSQLERGLKSPTLAVLMKIAKSLDTQPSKMLALLERTINDL